MLEKIVVDIPGKICSHGQNIIYQFGCWENSELLIVSCHLLLLIYSPGALHTWELSSPVKGSGIEKPPS